MIKIAILEDEKDMEERLTGFLSKFFAENDKKYTISSFSTAESLLSSSLDFDISFIDINLPGKNGMEAAKEIREKDKEMMLIFVTSLVQFAIKGYEVNAFDYLVKPVNYASFSLTMKRVLPVLDSKKEGIMVTDNSRTIHKIYLNDLQYIEVRGHVLYFHTTNEVIQVYESLKKYEELLESYSFSSCNRSYLVNLKHVIKIDKNEVLVGNDRLIISRPKRTEFLEDLNKYFSSGVTK